MASNDLKTRYPNLTQVQACKNILDKNNLSKELTEHHRSYKNKLKSALFWGFIIILLINVLGFGLFGFLEMKNPCWNIICPENAFYVSKGSSCFCYEYEEISSYQETIYLKEVEKKATSDELFKSHET